MRLSLHESGQVPFQEGLVILALRHLGLLRAVFVKRRGFVRGDYAGVALEDFKRKHEIHPLRKVARDKLIVANMLENLVQENFVHLVLRFLRAGWSVFAELMHYLSDSEVLVDEHVEEPKRYVAVVDEAAGVMSLKDLVQVRS